ncbi:hypothetical protein NHQ30_006944 [Ciborinia camelliae]|nr:hypothetical protein NHQ30_006944 [Ciborinia camelliae]
MDHQQKPSQDGIVSPTDPQNQPQLENIEAFGATPSQNRSPPAKRQMRDRKPNNSINTKGNSRTPNRSARVSPTKPNSSKIFDTKAKIREEITNATLAQRNAFLVEKQDYFIPLLPKNNHIQMLITQEVELSEEEKAKRPDFVPYRLLEAQPKGIKATLKPYQLSGLSYMVYLYRNGANGILGDDMGLGKTLQTLSLIQYLKENYPTTGKGRLQRPFLIVCPLSVLGSWMTETEKWTDLRVVRFHGGREERGRLKHIIAGGADKLGNLSPQAAKKRKYKVNRDSLGSEVSSLDGDDDNDDEEDIGVDLVVTTYESYKSEQSWLKGVFVWRYVVLDEGQIIKNHASEVSKSLQGLKAEYRLLLSGTPLQNDLGELWALFHFLYPEVFVEKTRDLFAKGFNLSRGDYIKDVLVASRHLLELIMLRRTKTSPGVDLGLPPMEEVLLFVPLSPLQKLWYERLIKKTDTEILHELFDNNSSRERTTTENIALKSTSASDSSSKKRATWQGLMNLVIQLRKVCNHPYQFDDAEPNPYFPGQHLIEASGKFIVLDKLVTELVVEQKKKIIIFSGFTKMLDLVQELLALKGGDGSVFNTCRIDGKTGRARRNLAIRMFMDLTSNHNVFLISTRAGGLGLNLAAASEIILLDQDWNPQVTKQAIGRAYRIGLQKPLTVYQFVAQGTVEEQMMPRIAKKLYLSAKVTESMEDIYTRATPSSNKDGKEISNGDDTDLPDMDTTQLMTLIRRGASAISRPEIDVSKMLEWDWKTTVIMCKDQTADLHVRKDVMGDSNIDEDEAERQWLAEREQVQSRLFNGETIEDRRPKSSDSSEDFAPSSSRADRKIGKERTVMMEGYMVSKDSINNDQWEAVKPFSSANNTSSSASKREKRPDITSQKHCQVCKIGNESPLISCKFCPRSYHNNCLAACYQAKAKKYQFACPQHSCVDCKQKAGDVGGMLYKCRWCEKAQCEDCIDWKNFKPLGDTLTEFDILGFPKTSSAFYIQCQECAGKFENDGNFKALCDGLEKKWNKEFEDLNAIGDEMDIKMEVGENMGGEGSANKPIVIDDDESEVEEIVQLPATKMIKNRGNGRTTGFGGHRGHGGTQIGTKKVRRQAAKFTGDSPFATPARNGNSSRIQSANTGRRQNFMDKWTEPPATSMFNDLGQTEQSIGQVNEPEMRTAGTGMGMTNGQYGYGRYDEQATNGPYFVSQSGSNVGGHGNPSNVVRHSQQPDPFYVSPYEAYPGGHGSMLDIPRQFGQSGQPQAYASQYGAYAGGHNNTLIVPRVSGHPKPVAATMVATPGHQNINRQAGTGRRRSFMDLWTEPPSGGN